MQRKKRITRYLNTSSLSRPLITVGAVLVGSSSAHALDASALPQDPTLAGGNATFAQSGKTLNVTQTSNRAVIDWRSFNIGADAQTNFNQPNSGAIAVNRVNGSADPSRIEGGLHANGQVWILNPNGVLFGKTAHVDAAGIVASTANIDTTRFMAGDNRLNLTGADKGSVVNDGSISVGKNGLAAFVAPSVRNSGTITARVGKVALAAGTTFTLDLAGDRLVEIGLGAGKAVVDQSGKIVNPGGSVTLTARAAGQVVDSVINMSGVTRTASVRKVGGDIVLDGDTVNVSGTADASGTSGGNIAITGKTINVASNAELRSDAGSNGDGGTIKAVAAGQGNYAGSYSAKGGAAAGHGGLIETSGETVRVAGDAKIDASAAKGNAGTWLLDPLNITIASGTGGGLTGATVTTGAIQSTLAGGTSVSITTSQTGTDVGDLTLAGTITATSTGNAGLTLTGRRLFATGANTINIAGGALTLNVNAVNSLTDTRSQSTNWVNDALGMIGTVSGGTTVNLGAALYAPGVSINKSKVSLLGAPGAEIDVNPGTGQVNAINIGGGTDGVTVSGFKLRGEITGSYVDYVFGSGISRGVAVANGVTNVTIINNDIANVRNGILIDGRNTGSVTGNKIDNTKSAISVQYTDAGAGNTQNYALTVSGNSQGGFGNEWGLIAHLNGNYFSGSIHSNPTGTAASGTVQQALLAASAANAGWAVQDQAYTVSNRTVVFVNPTGSDSNQGSPKSKLATIQAGINAVVAGGTVNVNDGTYVISSSAPYLSVSKSLKLIGQSEAGTIIDAHAASQYGLRVTADNVTLSNFTLLGVTAAGSSYGIKVENNTDSSPDGRIYNLSISNVTSRGARKAQLDMNGTVGATIDHFTADGTSNGYGSGSAAGAGIAISDSANVTITNSSTNGNAWGGLALYETNVARNQQVTGIIVAANNIFSEAVPVYMEDTSASLNFGVINIAGFDYMIAAPNLSTDVFTFFQKTQQDAVNHAASLGLASAYVQGWTGTAGNNVFAVGIGALTGGGTRALSIATAVNTATAGGTVNVLDGAYTLSTKLNLAKSLSLIGAGAGTVITSNSNESGIFVTGDNVRLSSFTFNGPTAVNSATYGIKVQPDTTVASDRILGFAIDNVTINRGYRTGLDVHAANGATIDNVSVSNIVNGNGIGLTDSANVTITNSTTSNNAWGGLAIYQANKFYNQQINGISVNATNSFNEANAIYAEDQSASQDVGTLALAGFNYVVKSPNLATDVYTFFQKTQQGAINFATNVLLNGGNVNLATATVQGYAGNSVAGNNVFTVGIGSNGTAMSIQTAVNTALSGATVNVLNGTYIIPGGGNWLEINKSLSLVGQSQAGTIINGSGASGYGLRVEADNVTLRNFTLLGATGSGGYGIKVQPVDGSGASSRINNFAIDHVTINGAAKNALDLNGVNRATIDNVTARNAAAGVGIALIDSANVTVTNSTTLNNGWGGVRIEEKNASYNQQTNAVTVDASNSFNEAVPLYMEDNSASRDFGTVTIGGLGFIVRKDAVTTWFQKTQQNAVDYAVNLNEASAYVQGWGGSAGNNIFTVGTGTLTGGGTRALSIQAAQNAASSGATINILSGAYAGNLVANARTNFNFGTVSLSGSFTLNAAAAGSALSGSLSAAAIALNGAVSLSGATILNTSAANGNISTAAINGTTAGGQTLTILSGTGTVSLGSLGATTRLGAVNDSSATILTGGTYNANSLNFGGALTLAAATTLNTSTANGGIVTAAINGSTAGGQALTILSGTGTVSLGSLGATTRLGAVSDSSATALTGTVYNANSLNFGGLTLAASATLNTSAANGSIVTGAIDGSTAGGQALTVNAGSGAVSLGSLGASTRLGAVSDSSATTLTGGTYNAGSLNFGGALTLTTATTLNTSAANGGIVTAQINGSAAGGQALTVNAGSGTVSLGSLGASTRLGAFTDASTTILTGDTYNAGSLNFAGDVTLTAANTSLDTSQSAGDITVSGTIFGSVDGKQNLVLTAGSGTGSAAANGNILLQSVGVKGSLALGDLTVIGNNFGAQTVSVANFKAKLVGNQIFSSHTLNASGTVDSTVGGSASGPINAAGAVGLSVSGDVTGAIVGHAVILNAGSITGATVTGTDMISVTANSVGTSTLSAPTVSATAATFNTNVNASNVTLNAGTISGSTITGSQNITVTANNVGSSSFTAPTVGATAANFNSAVNASGTANISGGTIAGTFTGGSFSLSGTTSVNATVSAKSANISSSVISGSYSGAAVSLSGSTSVNATVDSNSLTVQSPNGKLAGTWDSLDTGASGTLVVNNQASFGNGSVGASQIVVENFLLPSGTVVRARGDLILPQGLMIGLLSPGGSSAPKLIQVQDVYSLGALLSSGYTAIIIDLSGTKKAEDKTVRVSMN